MLLNTFLSKKKMVDSRIVETAKILVEYSNEVRYSNKQGVESALQSILAAVPIRKYTMHT